MTPSYPSFDHQQPAHPTMNYPHLFSPYALGPLALKNRAVVSSLTRASATDYYQRYAQGGWGLIGTEATYVDQQYSQGYLNQPGIASQAQAQSWRDVVHAVHAHGTPIYMQLFHGGAVNQGNHWVEGSIAPSAIPPKGVQISRYRGNGGPFQTPREITPQQIHAVIESFAQAAQRAIEAGFDGVEIHGANGYLPDQFLTTYTNQRRDHYNGDVRQRLRFHLELLRAVREAIPGRLLGVRMSQTKVNDLEYNWPGQLEDARVIFSEIAQTGVDFIHVAAHQGVTPVFGSSQSLSGLAKTFSGLPVITNGKLQDPALADQALADGEGDLVSIGKGALADADWATKVQNGVPPIQFHPDMITPYATLDNHEQWMATHGS
jgi:2,4-dienoyl-CoA reductase-like NADH-dependent reductase (Old Yellow Enzyme family)